jgi:hypothetical protein
MIELIVLACLISDPSRCQDVALKYSHEATSMRECAMSSQIETARWSGDNPDWQIKRMSCVRPTQSAQADKPSQSAQAEQPAVSTQVEGSARLASRIVD